MKQKIHFLFFAAMFSCLVQAGAASGVAVSGPVITVDSVINVSCYGGTNGAIYITVTGGVPPYRYAWVSGATTQNVTGLVAGTWVVTVTDNISDTVSKNIVVTQPSCPLAPNVTYSGLQCFGSSNGTASAPATCGTPPYFWIWSNGSTTSALSGLSAGPYTCSVTDWNGCIAQSNFTLIAPSALSATATALTQVPCYGGSYNVMVTATGGTPPYAGTGTYIRTAGTITFIVTDANNCQAPAVVSASQPSPITITMAKTNVSCSGGNTGSVTTTITGGTPGYTYIWNTGAFTTSLNGLTSGTYSITVTDINTCTATGSITITQPTLSISTNVQNATCGACTDGLAWVNATGNTSPYTYVWNTNPVQTTDTATALSKGTYVICVTDKNGCTVCDSASVGVGNCSAGFTIVPDTAVLHHYFLVNSATGVAPLSYLWKWGDGATDTAAYPNHTYAAAGVYNICLTITDATLCTNSYCYSSFLQRTDNSMISVTVVHSLITGTMPATTFNETTIFPNPANDAITISYFLSKTADVKIEIYNSFGQKVKEISSRGQSSGRQEITVDTKLLTEGVYFLKIEIDGNTTVTRVIKI